LTFERVVRPAGPFSLAQSLKHASDATRYQRDGTLTTTLRVGGRVEIGSVRQTVDGSVVLRAERRVSSGCGLSFPSTPTTASSCAGLHVIR